MPAEPPMPERVAKSPACVARLATPGRRGALGDITNGNGVLQLSRWRGIELPEGWKRSDFDSDQQLEETLAEYNEMVGPLASLLQQQRNDSYYQARA